MTDPLDIDIREARRVLGLTQAQLAAMLGCRVEHVKKLEAAPGAGHARRLQAHHARLLRAYLDGYRPADWPS